MKRSLLLVLLVTIGFGAYSQSQHSCAAAKTSAYQRILKRTRAGVADNALMNRYNVHWYFLDLNIERNSTVLSGNTTIAANTTMATDTFCFELNSSLTIDSIIYQNNNIPFVHTNTSHICYAMPNNTIPANSNVSMKIYYHGDASVVGGSAIGDGFSTDTSPTWGNSVTWSLSEPYSAREWFPCKQFLKDKADSVTVYVTTDNQNKVGSNGILKGIDPFPNNKVRYRWHSNYITDYYLISVAVAKYVEHINWAKPTALAGDSIEIVNYIYDNPACLPNFQSIIDSTAVMVEFFSDKLGLYPFYQEKYGHAMAPFSGGMEHQTMSSMGFFNFGLVAHELMHQWFGDYVTCSTWSDIFINEGFASYGAYMATEEFRGLGSARALMQDVHDDVMAQPGGSIYFTDTSNVNRIFSGRLSYDKGNAVIHSLRFELGDSVFYAGLRNFLTQFAFGNASIDDFKLSMENTSGKNLTDFFNQWIYGEGYPIIKASYFSDLSNLYLRIEHGVSSNTPTFITPLEIKCNSILNGDTMIRIDVTSNNDTYIIPMSKAINGLEIDPNNWILNLDSTITLDPSLISLSASNIALNNEVSIYPNPTNDFVTIESSFNSRYTITVRNLLGMPLRKLSSNQSTQKVDVSTFANGVYLLEINSERGTVVKKLIKQ
jgi:aminopeptidase N